MLKYNFESNSQHQYNLKTVMFVGNYMLKYNFESNSQLNNKREMPYEGWELYAKVQF